MGRQGEIAAAQFLRKHGYRILLRNFRIPQGEIDLVCRDGETLAFVEVKTRRGEKYQRIIEAVDAKKRRKLKHAAKAYLKELDNPEIYYRFDVVEVLWRIGQKPECRLTRQIEME